MRINVRGDLVIGTAGMRPALDPPQHTDQATGLGDLRGLPQGRAADTEAREQIVFGTDKSAVVKLQTQLGKFARGAQNQRLGKSCRLHRLSLTVTSLAAKFASV